VDGWREDMLFVEGQLRERAVRPQRICSSALERARQTAEYFAAQWGVDGVLAVPALNEVNYGELYEKNKQWVARHYPLHKVDPDFVYPQGESFSQMQARAVAFTLDMVRKEAADTVLAVVHAGVIRALVSHFLALDFAAQLKHKVSHRYIGVLQFAGEACTGYDEWGKPSGFADDGKLMLPHVCQMR
jgi:alpha-ribazole phosphatase